MVYPIDHHFIRINMAMDRTLQLVNAVFWLGIPEKECRFAVVANNLHVAETEVGQHLKQLECILKPYRSYRNTIIHRRQFTDESLERVEPLYVLEKIDSEDSEDFIGQYRHLFKRLTDQLVREERREFTADNQVVFDEVAKLFASLLHVFMDTQAKLKNVS